jgi:halocyanin-like protein
MTDAQPTASRRSVLRAGAAAAAGGTLAGLSAPAAAASPYDGWLDNTSNFEETVDKTGQDEVTIEVGVQGNNGTNAFGPAAVQVDPGTTVVWKWTGQGSHNVKANDGSFESEITAESGFTFEQTFEEKGVVKYACTPHKVMGMKGVVAVGDIDTGGGSQSAESGSGSSGIDYGDWLEDTSNFEETVDKTGQDEVTIQVGVEGNNGTNAFGPAAVQVDPGTTVVWEWTGQGSHNVIEQGGAFESEITAEAGFTFEQTFEEAGIVKYACTPHKAMGMKGAVVVGDVGGGGGSGGASGTDIADLLTIGGAVGIAGTLIGLAGFGASEGTGQ